MRNFRAELVRLRPGPGQHQLASSYGAVEIIEEGEERLRGGLLVRNQRYVWKPCDGLREELDYGFSIEHPVRVLPSGYREVMPPHSYSNLGFAAGHLILSREKHEVWTGAVNPLPAQLLRARAPYTRAFIDRDFADLRDLRVVSGSFGAVGSRSVLPFDMGLDANGEGQPWTVERLMDEGRRRAVEDGKVNADVETVISYGLMVAAEINPLDLPDEDCELLVRGALFNLIKKPEGWDDQIVDLVLERFVAAVERRKYKDQKDFDESMRGGNSSLVTTLMGKAGTQGGPLARPVVHFALQELTWLAYLTTAVCLDWYAVAFLSSLEHPLTEDELVRFEQLHRSQSILGDLTLDLVWRRKKLLQPIFTRIWTDPNDKSLRPILWSMFNYYGQIAELRRSADRESKLPGFDEKVRREQDIHDRDQLSDGDDEES